MNRPYPEHPEKNLPFSCSLCRHLSPQWVNLSNHGGTSGGRLFLLQTKNLSRWNRCLIPQVTSSCSQRRQSATTNQKPRWLLSLSYCPIQAALELVRQIVFLKTWLGRERIQGTVNSRNQSSRRAISSSNWRSSWRNSANRCFVS